MFRKILIANRGEIAVRVMRACREMGIRTVAVYSDVDRKSLHVRYADQAFHIGPAPSTESYLRIDRLLDAAKRSGAEAIHPGYGFLAENPEFARACADAGLVFIGPPVAAMELMGSKTTSRQAVIQAGLPVVPGADRNLESLEEAHRVADEIGYPVMLKASAGGGGKGLRLVRSHAELESAYNMACSEAQNAFNDPSVYIEKYLDRPRHIEIQILGDQYGHLIHLCERECSLQRRHQKVMEECPSPIVDEDLRRRMGETAVRIGKLAGYWNAGTVEFLVDQRRQFLLSGDEHAASGRTPGNGTRDGNRPGEGADPDCGGGKLAWRQEDVRLRGAAIECRIYAEDPTNNFFPSPGYISRLQVPAGPGVRRDSGVYEGWTVPLEYDPLLSKIAVWGTDRAEAIARMRRALGEYEIFGIKTNIPFFRRVLEHPDFVAGHLDTGFIDRVLAAGLMEEAPPSPEEERVAMLAAALHVGGHAGKKTPAATRDSTWKNAGRDSLLNQWPHRGTRRS